LSENFKIKRKAKRRRIRKRKRRIRNKLKINRNPKKMRSLNSKSLNFSKSLLTLLLKIEKLKPAKEFKLHQNNFLER